MISADRNVFVYMPNLTAVQSSVVFIMIFLFFQMFVRETWSR